MAGEGQFGLGREDADFRGVAGIFRRQHEGRLGIVEFGRDGLHAFAREPLGVEHDGERVAAEGAVGEDVDGGEMAFHDFKNRTSR